MEALEPLLAACSLQESHLTSPSLNNPYGIFAVVAAYCGMFLNPVIYLSHYNVVKTALVGFMKSNQPDDPPIPVRLAPPGGYD